MRIVFNKNYKQINFPDMHRLLSALDIPSHYICNQHTKASGVEALMILLRRLVYPNRWCDLVDIFGRSESHLSLICNKVLHVQMSYVSRNVTDITH